MSDWEMRDWRVPPRTRYAFAFLALAVMLTAVMMGASMTVVPDTGAFDDDQMEQVAENRLFAVEAIWLDKEMIHIGDFEYGSNYLDRMFPTEDPTVRWLVDSYLKLYASNKEQKKEAGKPYSGEGLHALTVVIDDRFGRVSSDGTYCAWELRFNGTRVHFGSDTVDGPGLVPETRWSVSHDYSGESVWTHKGATVPFRAKLVFHLWFETEEPSF